MDWDEKDHPRGQPDNAGQFVEKEEQKGKETGEGKSWRQGTTYGEILAEQSALPKKEEQEITDSIPVFVAERCKQFSEDEIKRSSGWLSGLGREDEVLKSLIKLRGFDAKPKVVSSQELRELVGKGYFGFTRGMKVDYGAEQYKTGEMFVGRGVHGHGVYISCFSTDTEEIAMHEAEKYSTSRTGEKGSVIFGVIEKDAKIIKKSELNAMREKLSPTWSDKEKMLFHDNGKLAVALGYDIIDCENEPYYIVLNRGKTIVGE